MIGDIIPNTVDALRDFSRKKIVAVGFISQNYMQVSCSALKLQMAVVGQHGGLVLSQ